jgi:hypothetical protein
MKAYIPAIVLFLLGFILIVFGSLFKIQHWPYGSELFTVGMLIKAVAAIYTIIVLFKTYKQMN